MHKMQFALLVAKKPKVFVKILAKMIALLVPRKEMQKLKKDMHIFYVRKP
jgi:hypothetical protein